MTYEEIIKGLQAKLGGNIDLTPDQDGVVALDVDSMRLTIMNLPELGQLSLSAPVGEPPPADRLEGLYKAILSANHFFVGTGGATMSINPETDEITIFRIVGTAQLDGEMLYTIIEGFINTLDTWRKLVSNYRGGVESADAPANGDGMPPLSGFMQV